MKHEYDRYGVPIAGEDEYRRWLGTADLPVPLGKRGRRVLFVWGYLGPEMFQAVLRTGEQPESVAAFFSAWGVRDVEVHVGKRSRITGQLVA